MDDQVLKPIRPFCKGAGIEIRWTQVAGWWTVSLIQPGAPVFSGHAATSFTDAALVALGKRMFWEMSGQEFRG
jgi:hypothetical protein